jgi:single-strand DNA-binding protein
MASINKVILLGNITRTPELAYTPRGTAILELGLATNRRWKDEAGNPQEKATFIETRLWGKTAETAAKYLAKGSSVLIEGRLEQDEWNDKDTGKPRKKTVVIVDTWQFGGPKAPGTGSPAPRPEPKDESPFNNDPDDIPY